MSTLADILIASGAVLGFLVGRVSGYHHARGQRPKPPSYLCACGHPISMHQDRGDGRAPQDRHAGKCAHSEDQDRWSSSRSYYYVKVACDCLGYIGERPVELMAKEFPL